MLRSDPGNGGGSDGWSFDMDCRCGPCPAGTAGLHLVWPGRGIPTSRIEVDGGAVRAAADTAVTLWPNDPYCGGDN
jgi:hypothetical protein